MYLSNDGLRLGIDPAPEMIAVARRKASRAGKGLAEIKGDDIPDKH